MSTAWQLRGVEAAQAATVAGWHLTPAETLAWCGSQTPVTAEVVAGWSQAEDVEAYVLVEAAGARDPVAYGELWVDADEGEVELARLVVDPARRGQGIGRTLTGLLAARARADHPDLPTVALRVRPENAAARRAYARAGFVRVDAAEEDAWNAGQPVAYCWMVLPPER